MTDQNDDGKNSNKRRRPSITDEASGAGMSGGDSPLKKGPWSADEDEILKKYVRMYGAKDWDSVKKCTRLRRNGKSCRLRWVNQLRPDLKEHAITRYEKKRIVDLHAQMGNKWAKIAAKLPGRTDNDIKNYWKCRKVPLNQAASQGCQNMGTVQPLGQFKPPTKHSSLGSSPKPSGSSACLLSTSPSNSSDDSTGLRDDGGLGANGGIVGADLMGSLSIGWTTKGRRGRVGSCTFDYSPLPVLVPSSFEKMCRYPVRFSGDETGKDEDDNNAVVVPNKRMRKEEGGVADVDNNGGEEKEDHVFELDLNRQ